MEYERESILGCYTVTLCTTSNIILMCKFKIVPYMEEILKIFFLRICMLFQPLAMPCAKKRTSLCIYTYSTREPMDRVADSRTNSLSGVTSRNRAAELCAWYSQVYTEGLYLSGCVDHGHCPVSKPYDGKGSL